MMLLGTLLALAVLALPVTVIWLVVVQGRLRARLDETGKRVTLLETELARVIQRGGAAPAPLAPPVSEAVPAATDPVAPAVAVTGGPWAVPTGAKVPPAAPMPDMAAPAGPGPAEAATGDGNARPPVVPAGPSAVVRLIGWLQANWVYAVSAASLALAGVFFVQYGVERGLLPPGLRVLLGIGFGLSLITAGEVLRRRFGDGEAASTAYLPSVFSGAGLVSVFAAILAARQMYGLIGPEVTFAGLLVTALGAVVLGWFHGPLLVAVGLIGATAAPFLTGGGSVAPDGLQAHMVLVAGLGLAVDSLRRWGWVSVLALVLGYAGVVLVDLAGAGTGAMIAALAVLPGLAMAIPARSLWPDHAPPGLIAALRGKGRPGFPVLLAAGAVVASTLLLVLSGTTEAEAALACAALAGLAVLILIWSDRAQGLHDLALIPAAGFLARLVIEGAEGGPLARGFGAAAIALRAPETAAPLTVTLLLIGAGLMSAAFAWRGLRGSAQPLAMGLAAALAAPVTVAVLELFWAPALVLGAYPWALQVMAVAAGMVAVALAFARADGVDHARAAYATLAALSLMALAVFLVLSATALTLALAVLVVVAAGLDRRFRLPEMGLFVQAAVAVLGYRLLVDPGLGFALEGPLPSVLAAFGGSMVGLGAALWLLAGLERPVTRAVLESAIAGFGAVLANVVLVRWLTGGASPSGLETHWGVALNALPWLILMLMQIYRAAAGGPMARVRRGIAFVAGLIGFGWMALAVVLMNPLFGLMGARDPVRGPMILDSLALAYGLPGLMLLAAAWRLPGLGRWGRGGLTVVGAGLAVLYVGLEIRRFWQGDTLSGPGVLQGELYSYTIALLLAGAGLLYQAIASGSGGVRRLAMAVIGLTVAKVFLIDASGLTGLTRVFSFLALGLSLAGLAWLNRWAQGAGRPQP